MGPAVIVFFTTGTRAILLNSTSYPAQGSACFAWKWELGEPWFLVSWSSGEDWKYPALTTEEVQHCSEQRERLW